MKAIFLDRDGVINRDPLGGYITRPEDFYFLDGAKEAVRKLTEAGYQIIIISNQAGVGKGLFTLDALDEVTKKMIVGIEAEGGRIHSVFYCPHTKEDDCECKKPKTGLFKKATRGMDIDFSKTYFIGDGTMDIEAGKEMGCKTILLLSGKTKLEDKDNWPCQPDYIFKNLLEAVNWISECER